MCVTKDTPARYATTRTRKEIVPTTETAALPKRIAAGRQLKPSTSSIAHGGNHIAVVIDIRSRTKPGVIRPQVRHAAARPRRDGELVFGAKGLRHFADWRHADPDLASVRPLTHQ